MEKLHLGGLLLAAALMAACGDKEDDSGTDGDGGSADGGSDGGSGDGGSDGGSGDGGSSVGDTVVWQVNHHLDVCSGEGQWLCPLGQRDGSSDWERIGCGIVGLDFAWGTSYTVTTEITAYDEPEADGCGYVFTLVSVDAESFDGGGEAFELPGLYGVMITPGEGGGSLDGGHAFTCASTEVCEDLAAVEPDWAHVYTLSMRNPDTVGEPLVLTGIVESR